MLGSIFCHIQQCPGISANVDLFLHLVSLERDNNQTIISNRALVSLVNPVIICYGFILGIWQKMKNNQVYEMFVNNVYFVKNGHKYLKESFVSFLFFFVIFYCFCYGVETSVSLHSQRLSCLSFGTY